MKKSEVLNVLGSYVVNNYTEMIFDEEWLIVEVTCLTAYHMCLLDKYILQIEPTNNKSMLVHFCSMVKCD